ncbi:YrhK family protein [Alteribacillus bidgolensis]|uniref:YrhK-like protein n=1 Tax=Alteribacillus bidgolensis TaxID=930129 RepID=A0A1G8NHE6_9BACI|nr:YrhK family protein [Alteribacillus bidgolensis]SDI79507.1 YrhK-like protein [Alteribacillus bidgolensis]
MPAIKDEKHYVNIKAGRFRVFFRKRYRLITTLNDILIGFLFVLGSCLNFFQATANFGNVAYLLASFTLTVRPILKLIHNSTLRNEMKDKDSYNINKTYKNYSR